MENSNLLEKVKKFIKDEDGQVSIETMIIIAAVIAIALILVTQLQKTAKTGAEKIDDFSSKAFDNLDKTVEESLD